MVIDASDGVVMSFSVVGLSEAGGCEASVEVAGHSSEPSVEQSLAG